MIMFKKEIARRAAGLCLAPLALLAVACQSNAVKSVDAKVKVLGSSSQCGHSERGLSARWLGDDNSLREAAASLADNQMGDVSKRLAASGSGAAALMVYQGQQSSGGYSLELASDMLSIDDGTASVSVKVNRPASGSMTASVMTSPCLLLSLPAGDYDTVQVLDTSGAPLTRTAVSR